MRPEKDTIVSEVRGAVGEADFTILTDYLGMRVEQLSDLRGRLNDVNGRLQVVKNTVLALALTGLGRKPVESVLRGGTAIVTGKGDVAGVAKLLKQFTKENKLPVVKGGWLGGNFVSAADVEAMAAMPAREIMLGMFVGTVAAPMTQLVGALNQKVLSLLYVLKAAADKKSGE